MPQFRFLAPFLGPIGTGSAIPDFVLQLQLPGGHQHTDAPLKGAIAFAPFVLLEHALKHEVQVCRINGHGLVGPLTNQLSVADIVGPGFDSLGRSNVRPTGEWPFGAVGKSETGVGPRQLFLSLGVSEKIGLENGLRFDFWPFI
jgi:hypothetical protein